MIADAAQIVQYYLVSEGVGVLSPDGTEWRVLRGFMPTTGHTNQMCCGEYGAVFDGRLSGTGEENPHPAVQIWVRATDYATGKAKAKAVEAAMNRLAVGGWTNVVIGSETAVVQGCANVTGIVHLPRVEKETRENFTLNYRLTISEG